MNETVIITRAGTLPRIWSFIYYDTGHGLLKAAYREIEEIIKTV